MTDDASTLAAQFEIRGDVVGVAPRIVLGPSQYQGDMCTFGPSLSGLPSCGTISLPQPPPAGAFPNDPRYWGTCGLPPYEANCQWGLHAIGISEAWGVSLGSEDVIVAILDTGIDSSHPELSDSLVSVGPYRGIDVTTPGGTAEDDYGHGTAMAGIVAAKINNGIEMAGLSRASLLNVKVCKVRDCYLDWVAEGLALAAIAGADVISISIAGWVEEGTANAILLQRAATLAAGRDVFMTAAGGNTGKWASLAPANLPEVFGVSGVGIDQQPSWTFGPHIDLAAPGGNKATTTPTSYQIYTTMPQNSYGYVDGSSPATAFVAATAALLRSAHPEWTRNDVWDRLVNSADPAGFDVPNEYVGAGLLDASAALASEG